MTAEKVLQLSDLEQDTAVRVEVGGVAIAVVLDGQGEVHAIGDTCTHGDISLADGFVEGESLECWAHGSAFSLRTGRPLNLPAYEPVPVYEVTIDGDDILIDPAVTKAVN
ncbi:MULTISPECIES: non-heme iron oxygenase ferredoxin subunit [Microbacterium]|uniref:Non-heme iron oxygenase ferredoxin subunit n=1 Tax=Microbacterium oleivorans TaxID=273677 RepID=A0A4R5YDW9_9MICO|nr:MULTISPECIES: non-heme iron oxygenase ferredoxin subunit [Microbacterium]MDQ1127087.1 3-phenylpropionate/trans-cinnamate dioxygenase ferredoxin subunit [Microbacterium sp. SORGH_AS_0505]TDL43271.1 non-heme iron oxygenase ferredoxin subunit [Microbacterium oleivorans]SCY12473.1 3-phenylpropionate/trans-cinnamate dioxygenase ferredoxin subunit [Microbacterium sp. LKL04]